MDTRDKKKLYKNCVGLVAETPVDPVVRHMVEKRIYFFRELGQASKTTRKLFVCYMTREQNEALVEVVGEIAHKVIKGSVIMSPSDKSRLK